MTWMSAAWLVTSRIAVGSTMSRLELAQRPHVRRVDCFLNWSKARFAGGGD